MAPISVGDPLPNAEVWTHDAEGNKKKISIHEWAAGKKVIILGVPGAFTPTCSMQHLPGFIEKSEELKKFVDGVACVSVNDPFVMKEWAKTYPDIDGKVQLLADGSVDFTRALGFDIDLSAFGLGVRSRRFSLLADNLVVKILHLEEGGEFKTSGAEDLLKELSA